MTGVRVCFMYIGLVEVKTKRYGILCNRTSI